MKYSLILLSITILFFNEGLAQKKQKEKTIEMPIETIKWYTFQQAVELNKKQPKKLFIDVYTEWCGWCKKMDASTFTDPIVIKTMNKYYYAIKMDAEMTDTIVFQNTTFVNPEPAKKRSTHQLANALLNGQLGYPTAVYLDEQYNMLSPVAGYQTPEAIEPILIFFGENKHKTGKYEDFVKTFKPQPR